MVDLSKLESEQVELKVENEYRRLKKNAYQREYYSKTVDENKRLKQNAYNRKWYAKNKRSKRMIANANQEQAARKVENKRPRTRAASEGQCEGARCIRGAVRRGALHLMAPVAVAPPPLRFSFQPLAGHKVRLGCGAQSPARKKPRIGCGAQSPARKKTKIILSPYSNHSASGGTFSPSNPAAVQTNMFEFAKHFGPLLRAWFPGG